MKIKEILIHLLTVLIVLSIACKEQNKANTEVIEGVELIHNTEIPMYSERTVSFEEELSIREEDKSGNIILFRPSWYAVDNKENIFISDWTEKNIKVFDKNGNYIKTIGNKGEGPGEFNGIARIGILPDGRLIVMDFGNRRTSLFNQDGEFIKSNKWKHRCTGLFLTTDASYTSIQEIFNEKKRTLVKTFGLDGNEIVTFGEFTSEDYQILRQKGLNYAISLPYNPHSIFAGDQKNQWLYHCLNNQYLIEVYDVNGKMFRQIDRPYEPILFTKKDADEYYSRFDPESVYSKMAKEVELPKHKTVIEGMVVDDQSNIWIKTNESKFQAGRKCFAYDIFNEDGYYITRIWNEIGPGLFMNGKMYRLDTNKETEIRTLKRYRVIWN